MTATLDSELDELPELPPATTPGELAPQLGPGPDSDNACDLCELTFPGAGGKGRLTYHRTRVHGISPVPKIVRPRGRPKKAAGAKKAAPAKVGAAKKLSATVLPEAPARRKNASEFVSDIVGMLGTMIENIDVPVGRALQLEAPIAGPVLDRVIAGGRIDKVVQRGMAGKDRYEGAASVLAMPVLIALAEHAPEMRKTIYPLLRAAMSENLIGLVGALKQKRAKEAAVAHAVEELRSLDPELEELFASSNADPIDVLIRSLGFGPVTEETT